MLIVLMGQLTLSEHINIRRYLLHMNRDNLQAEGSMFNLNHSLV